MAETTPPQNSRPPSRTQLRNQRLLLGALLGLAGLGIMAALFFIAGTNLDTALRLNHVTGAWIGLAWWFDQGVYFPPLFNGSEYGGSRFGPLPVALQGLLYSLIDEPIRAGKLMSLGTTVLLAVVSLTAMRRLRVGWGLALFMTALWMLTTPGQLAVMSIRHDALATLFQLLAVLLLVRQLSMWKVIAAALCCTLAFYCKVSSVWAPLGLAVHLLIVHRKYFLVYAAVGAGSGVLAAGLVHLASGGRVLENYALLMFAGETGSGAAGLKGLWLGAMDLLHWLQNDEGLVTTLAIPFVILGLIRPVMRDPGHIPGADDDSRPRFAPLSIALMLCAGLTAYVAAKKGISFNHFFDLVVLSAVAAAAGLQWAWDYAFPQERALPVLALPRGVAVAATGTLIVGAALSFYTSGVYWLLDTDLKPVSANSFAPIAPGDALLSTDAMIPIYTGSTPVVLDAFALSQFDATMPEAVDALIARIDAGEFKWLVAAKPLDQEVGNFGPWGDNHWGKRITQRIHEQYTLRGPLKVGPLSYVLYQRNTPHELSEPTATPPTTQPTTQPASQPDADTAQ